MKKIYSIVSVCFLLILCAPLVSPNSAASQNLVVDSNKSTASSQGLLSTNSNKVTTVSTATVSSSTSNNPSLTTANTGAWQQLGPLPINNPNNQFTWGSAPFSGRVTAIAINNSNSQEIYVGAAGGGVWKTLNDGSTWVPLMDSQNTLAVGAIAISPDTHTLYVGTGEGNHGGDNYAGIGLLKSTDEGKTFTTLGANYFNGSSITSIIINSNNPSDIVVSTTWGMYARGLAKSQNPNGLGVYRSTDGGNTWSLTLGSTANSLIGSNGVADLVANTSDPNNMYAGTFNGYIYLSTDGGATWPIWLYQTTTANQGRIALAVTPINSSLLYAVWANSTGEILSINCYMFQPGYSTYVYWNFNSLPNPTSNEYGPCTGQCWYNLVIAVDPINVNTIYVGTNNLYKSINFGGTWSLLGGAVGNGYLHPDQHAFAFSPSNPSTIYSGNDGGIYKSTDGGSAWTSLNTNLGITQFDSIAASPTNDSHIIGGAQDNACDIYNNNTGWTITSSGDGAATAFLSDTVMACNYVHLKADFSSNDGLSFYNITAGLISSDPSEFYAPMVQDPSNPYTLYLGSDRIYKLNEKTDTAWTDISGVISNGMITTIAVSRTNSNDILEGDSQGIVKLTTNGGTTWNTIFSGNIPITSVTFDPFNSSQILFSTANKSNSRLFVSLDQGINWYYYYLTGVPNVAINVVRIDPITDNVFLGTDQGLYYSTDGVTWSQLGSGLPNAAIWSMAFTASNYIVVGTHGRGAWINYMTPTVSMNPGNNSYLQSGRQVSFTIADSNGFTNASYHWDSGLNVTATSNDNTYVPNSAGQHILYVYAMDPAGNWIAKKYFFTVDNTPPTISLNQITNGSVVKIGSSINFAISDSSPIINVSYSLNGNSNVSSSLINGILDVTVPNTNGQIIFKIYAEDAAYNIASSTYVFTILVPTTTQASTTNSLTTSSSSKSHNTPGFEVAAFIVALSVLLIRKKKKK